MSSCCCCVSFCLGRSSNQRDMEYTLIWYSREKADTKAIIQVQRFQLRHEVSHLTRFSDWSVRQRGPGDLSVGSVLVPPLPHEHLPEREAVVSELGSRPTCCGQELWRKLGSFIPDEAAEWWGISEGPLGSLNLGTLGSVWGVPLTLYAFLLRPLSPETLPG